MELSSPEGPRRRFIETKEPDVGQVPVEQGRRHRAIVETMFSSTSDAKPSLLAPLAVGDRLPWKLDREGEPQWLVIVDVLSSTSYLVRYPDGRAETLVDSE